VGSGYTRPCKYFAATCYVGAMEINNLTKLATSCSGSASFDVTDTCDGTKQVVTCKCAAHLQMQLAWRAQVLRVAFVTSCC
jgi:hypothetical protein